MAKQTGIEKFESETGIRAVRTAPVKLKFVPTNVYTRWGCTVCGGCTEKVSVLCEDRTPQEGGARVRVCEQCLKDRDFDQKLRDQAIGLEQHAAYLRSLIGRLDVPTYQEWLAAEQARDAEIEKEFADEACKAQQFGDGEDYEGLLF